MKKNLLFIFWIVAGIVLGALIASLCSDVPGLSWLSYSAQVGISQNNPFVLDLIVLTLTIGFSLNISVAHIFTVCLSIFLYRWTVHKL